MHDTTPTKLAQINRMSGSRFVFPGQILKLPPPEPPKPPEPDIDWPKEPIIDKDVVDLTNNFVRINVKHITEGKGKCRVCYYKILMKLLTLGTDDGKNIAIISH